MTKTNLPKATEAQDAAVPAPVDAVQPFSVDVQPEVAPSEPAPEVKPAVRSAGVTPPAMPDNSPKALEHNKLVTDSRAFLRGQGVADHLYSDETAISNYKRFKAWEKKGDAEAEFKLNLTEQKSHFDKNEGVVTRGEYSTSDKDIKPFYKDASKADTPTPAVLKNEGEVASKK